MFLFLPFFLVFCLWLRFEFRKSSNQAEHSKQNRLELEREANFTRKKSIDNLHYITFSEKSIPIIEINDDLIKKYETSLLKFVDRKVLNLSSMSNTDLKKEYGPANLTILSEYDENFSELIRCLHNYALRLHELDYTADAKTVLEYAVSIGSDMGSSYRLLADLYKNDNQPEKLQSLIEQTQNLNPLLRDSVTSYLTQILADFEN